MGEARRRAEQGLKPRQLKSQEGQAPKIFPGIPITNNQREQFFAITKLGAWIGIGLLIVLWVVVRFIGPSMGWWIPADLH